MFHILSTNDCIINGLHIPCQVINRNISTSRVHNILCILAQNLSSRHAQANRVHLFIAFFLRRCSEDKLNVAAQSLPTRFSVQPAGDDEAKVIGRMRPNRIRNVVPCDAVSIEAGEVQ